MLRLDGFVAAEAGFEGGELVTRPLTFDGDRLLLNLRKEGGRVRFWYDDRSCFATRYAESDDGTHFTRPELNLLGGDLPANAVMAMHRLQGLCLERRYKSQAKSVAGRWTAARSAATHRAP